MSTILITDSLFIGPDEEAQIKAAGYEIERLDKPKASEDELVQAIQGKVGYILGGIESVTDPVIEAADALKVIAFTGSGYSEFIPGCELATRRGIAISAAIGGNAESVAEWAVISGLALVRNIPALTTAGGPSFYIAREISGLVLGIVGLGHVGRAAASLARRLDFTVLATPASRPPEDGVETVELPELLERSDVIAVHVSKGRGEGVIDRPALERIRPGSVLVNAAFEHAVDNDALLERIAAGSLRAAVDYPLAAEGLPPGALLASNAQTAFNTAEANARISQRATRSLLELLATGDNVDLINPDYRSYQ